MAWGHNMLAVFIKVCVREKPRARNLLSARWARLKALDYSPQGPIYIREEDTGCGVPRALDAFGEPRVVGLHLARPLSRKVVHHLRVPLHSHLLIAGLSGCRETGIYCRTTSASTVPLTPRRTCCPCAYMLATVLRVSRSCELFPDALDLHLLHGQIVGF